VIVFTHEIGHNLGSPHTHCYSPPVDQCYNAEMDCYSGSVVITRGTIMSYCHLYAGVSNIDLEFGSTVSDKIRDVVEVSSCLTAGGGGGGGDGGDGGGGGSGGSANCGDGSLHPGETCDDGNKVDGDGCSASCQVEPGCGDGVLTSDEECDDGNTVSADGCSARCLKEPCTIKYQPQKLWEDARLEMMPGKRLSFRGLFGTATDVSAAAVNASGAHLLVTGIDGTPVIDAMLPAGRWSVKGRQATFRDGGSLYGIRKVTVRDRSRRDAPQVKVVVSAKGGVPDVDPSLLPLVVTVVLGDQAAGDAGACGRYAFTSGACDSLQHGRRILCR
jgi:cysteine-rich repeat protein